MADEQHELVTIPEDLKLISDDAELQSLLSKAVAEFDRVEAEPIATPKSMDYLRDLTYGIGRIRSEQAARTARVAAEQDEEQGGMLQERAALHARVKGDGSSAPLAVRGADADTLAAAITSALVSSGTIEPRFGGGGGRGRLSTAQALAPTMTPPSPKAVITAGVDIPGVARGGELTTLDDVVDAFHRRSKGLPDSHGLRTEMPVVAVRQTFEHTVDDRTSPAQVEELFRYLTTQDKQDALVAGGGWCAPSEVRYDFFNVAESDGLVDLPTFGVSRGGIRFPVSPSIADAFGASALAPFNAAFSNASVPWLWTETDDISTVTGAPNKPCFRVPCPTFAEARLECYGVCLTAGNLTDDAYPEATRNTLRLLMTAHAHAMNARIIATMVGASTAAITGGGFADANDPVAQVVGGLELAATDYRARYAMGMDTVLEVVAPFWVRDVLRASLRWRLGDVGLNVADAEIQSYFANINVRMQWVNDWQVRGAGQFGNATAMTAWPTAATFMIYAAGTFILGNGLTLDLGVVRDSTLNAENDFTAAWSEECHLVAKVGHESRLYTIGFSVSALTAPAATAAPNL